MNWPESKGRSFLFESAVLDSAPVFRFSSNTFLPSSFAFQRLSLAQLPIVIIETMEAGRSFAEGLKTAQELGVTETDPSHDIDGWDSTVKVCALASRAHEPSFETG